MSEKYDCSIICHSYPDFVRAKSEFSGTQAYYSSYSDDYIDIYKQFDLIVGTRIHGSGMASSLGIPSLTIPIDSRSETVKLFLSKLVEPEGLLNNIERIDISEMSYNLLEYKRLKFQKLKAYLKCIPFFAQ